jgi:hypothetical protein
MQHSQVRLESNATDDDAEAVIVVDAGIGFTRLAIFGPSGKLMHEIRAQNGGVGLTKMPMETPEPSLEEVEAAYPEGTYRFRGRTVDGSALTGEAIVSHALLAPATITAPVADASDVAVADLTVSWQPVAGATSYLIELEDDAVPAAVKADLPGAASSFTFSGGWIRVTSSRSAPSEPTATSCTPRFGSTPGPDVASDARAEFSVPFTSSSSTGW